MRTINKRNVMPAARPAVAGIWNRGLNFSAAAVMAFKLQAGRYIEFLQDDDAWYFIQNEDPDGFKLESFRTRRQDTLMLYSVPLSKMLRRSFGRDSMLIVFNTKRTFKGKQLFELIKTKKDVKNYGYRASGERCDNQHS